MAVVTGAFITYKACIYWEFESAVSLEIALFHRTISELTSSCKAGLIPLENSYDKMNNGLVLRCWQFLFECSFIFW